MNRSFVRPFLSLAVAFVVCTGASARDIFVNNQAGDDSFDGTKAEVEANFIGPVRTIQRGLDLLAAGDRLVIAKTEQPYREAISLSAANHRGTADNPLIIQGNQAVLDGSRPIDPRSWRHFAGPIYRYQPRRLGTQMLFLDGAPANRAMPLAADDEPQLDELAWTRDWRYVYFRPEKNARPDAYQLSHAVLDVGITLYHVENVRIEGLVIQGFRIDGVQFHDATANCQLVECTLRGNGRSGAAICNSSRATLAACLIGNNAAAQVLAKDFTKTDLVRCDIVASNDAPDVVTQDEAKVNVTAPVEGDKPEGEEAAR